MFKNLFKPFLLLVPIVMTLVVCEIALRLLFPVQIIRSEGGVKNNPLGWGPDLAEACDSIPQGMLASSRKRVALLGDSILNCWDSKDATEKIPGVLREILNQTQIDVLNFSSGGWGTDQEFLAFKKFGKAYQPSIVYLFFTPTNDLWNNLSRIGNSPPQSKPRFAVSPNGELALTPPEPMGTGRWWPVILQTQLGARLYQLFFQRNSPQQSLFPDSEVAAFLSPAPSWVEEGWKITGALIKELKREVEATGAQLAVVYVPVGVNTEEANCPEKACLGYEATPTTLACGDRTLKFDIHQPYERMRQLTRELNLVLIDNLDQMGTYQKMHNEIAYDCLHLTPTGSSLLAGRVAEFTNAKIGPIVDRRTAKK